MNSIMNYLLGKTTKTLGYEQIGQSKTDHFIKLSDITARPYPMTRVRIMFVDDGTIKDAMVIRDEKAESGPQNIMVEYNDNTTQNFTAADGEKIKIQIGEPIAHYRGGRKHKTLRNKNSMKSRKSKSMYKKPSRRNRK